MHLEEPPRNGILFQPQAPSGITSAPSLHILALALPMAMPSGDSAEILLGISGSKTSTSLFSAREKRVGAGPLVDGGGHRFLGMAQDILCLNAVYCFFSS